jgi:hypothetical protein
MALADVEEVIAAGVQEELAVQPSRSEQEEKYPNAFGGKDD